jgi:hypothetical protein
MNDGGAEPVDDAATVDAVAVPPAPSPLAPRRQALENVKDPKELTGEVVGGDGASGDLGSRTLSNLLRFHPFISFFCWLAHHQYPASHRPETRVSRLREDSPKFYWVCVVLDVMVVLCAVVGLLAAAGAVLYKTIWLPTGH